MTVLFIDVKGAFNHVSKIQLVARMIKLRVDGDLISWIKSFLTDRKHQLIIDGHNNQEKKVKTRISQRSLVLPILFLTHISRVFEQVKKAVAGIISLSFVDDLEFIVSRISVKEVAKILDKVSKLVFE